MPAGVEGLSPASRSDPGWLPPWDGRLSSFSASIRPSKQARTDRSSSSWRGTAAPQLLTERELPPALGTLGTGKDFINNCLDSCEPEEQRTRLHFVDVHKVVHEVVSDELERCPNLTTHDPYLTSDYRGVDAKFGCEL